MRFTALRPNALIDARTPFAIPSCPGTGGANLVLDLANSTLIVETIDDQGRFIESHREPILSAKGEANGQQA